MKMVACNDEDAKNALNHVFNQNPELARKAIITAFLFKNNHRWLDEDHSLDALRKEEDAGDEDEDEFTSGQDFEHLFDSRGDENA